MNIKGITDTFIDISINNRVWILISNLIFSFVVENKNDERFLRASFLANNNAETQATNLVIGYRKTNFCHTTFMLYDLEINNLLRSYSF